MQDNHKFAQERYKDIRVCILLGERGIYLAISAKACNHVDLLGEDLLCNRVLLPPDAPLLMPIIARGYRGLIDIKDPFTLGK